MNKQIVMRTVFGAAFILSLTANVATAGMFAGGAMGGAPVISKIAAAMTAFADLSPETRDKTVDIVKAGWPDVQDKLKDIREKRGQVKDILAKPDYKRADAEKILTDIRADVTALQEKGQTIALDVADVMTPQERAHLIDQLSLRP